MSRFYINDGAVVGARMPASEFRNAARGIGSFVLNEAQAIAKGLKLTATATSKPLARYLRLLAATPEAYVTSHWNDGWIVQEVEVWSAGAKLVLNNQNIFNYYHLASGGQVYSIFDGNTGGGANYDSGYAVDVGSTPKGLIIDLKTSKSIDALKLWDCGGEPQYRFTWEGSNDNASWTPLFDSGPRVLGINNVNIAF